MITACNTNETTLDTVSAWSLIDAARRYALIMRDKQAEEGNAEGSASWWNASLDLLGKQQHIERIVNNGENMTLANTL